MSEPAVSLAYELHERLTTAVREHNAAWYAVALLLLQMQQGSHHRELGYTSIYAYAEQVHDLSYPVAKGFLRVARAAPDLEPFHQACERGVLTWTKAREIAKVVTADNVQAWVERAKHVTSRQLEQHVAHAAEGDPPPDPDEVKGPARKRLVFVLDATDAETVEAALAVLGARLGSDEEQIDRGVLLTALAERFLEDDPPPQEEPPPRYRKILEECPSCGRVAAPRHEVRDTIADEARCDAEIVDLRPGHEGERSRTIPARVRRAVLARDRGRCIVPGCHNHLWVDVHHVRDWARGGSHRAENLVTLCTAHHRLVHEGLLALEKRDRRHVTVTLADGTQHLVRLGGWKGAGGGVPCGTPGANAPP